MSPRALLFSGAFASVPAALATLVAVAPAVAVAAPDAPAAEVPTDDAEAALEKARDHFARGEFAAAKDLLLAAYASSQRADLLFALGQAEFNLENFDAAIAYYEKFLATNPDAERTALTQQALGAARARIAAPKPPPPQKTIERHRWIPEYTGLAVLGVVGIGLGTALLVHGHGLGDDEGGSLADYDARIARSRSEQIAGLACTIGGALAIGGALIAWRVRTETVVAPSVTERAVGLAIGGRW